jgi:hypothetical protein
MAPIELWVLRDQDYEPALLLLRQRQEDGNGEPAADGVAN